jgi:hypothetical protein
LIHLTHRFSRQGLWNLFLVVAFPIHVWAFFMYFEDFAWIAQRTNAWDAAGVGAYALMVAFVESLVVFASAIAFSFLLPGRWTEARRNVLLGWLVWVTAIWGILGQLYFLAGARAPSWVYNFFYGQSHPARIAYGILLLLAVFTVLLPVYGVVKSEKFRRVSQTIFERVALLMMLYLVLDFLGLVMVIIRNF